jgi:hypothetical protein
MVRLVRFFIALIFLTVAGNAAAQFGHPLKGTWSGEWGTGKTHVVLEFQWDNKNLSGSINPGAGAVPFSKVTLDPATWMLHAEADKDGVKYVIDGKMENIGAYARFITGSWQQGTQRGNFKVTRN